MSGVYVNSAKAIYATDTALREAIGQLQEVGAIAPFIQTTNALSSWNTDQVGSLSNHNLLNNNTVLLDPITGDMSEMNSLSFTSGNIVPPVSGSLWLNDSNNHIYHGGVDLEATGGNVSSSILSSVTGNITTFSDTSGIIIGESNINIDSFDNINNTNSISFSNNAADPNTGSLWLNSMDNHLYHGSVDLETVGTGDVLGPANALINEIPLYGTLDGKQIKKSSVLIDTDKNMGSLKSLSFDSTNMVPVPGALWLNLGDDHLYHGSVDLEQVGMADVTGPASSTPRTVAIFTDGTGKLIGNSGVLIDNVGNVDSFKSILFDNSVSDPATGSLWLNSGDNHLYHGSVDLENLGPMGDVNGPASSLNNEVPVFSGTSGKIITNTGVLFSALGDVKGPGVAVNNNLPLFDTTSGKLIKDSGIASTSVGNVFGPILSTNNNIATFDLTTGKLIKDSGVAISSLGNVFGPASSLNLEVPLYSGTSGKIITNSGILSVALGDVKGPGVAVNNNLALFDTTSGKLIKDSGIASTSVGNVFGPVSSTNNNVTVFDLTTGKLIKDSGISANNLVQGPLTSVNNNLAAFDLTSGKLIKDSGILTANVGDVKGPGIAVNNNVVLFDSTTGKLIKDSGVNISGVTSGIAVITDVKPANTAGGTFTSGAWQTRTLNAITTQGNSGASLAANQITLTVGTYRVNGYAPARDVSSHQTRFQNITDGTTTIIGGSQFSQDAAGVGLALGLVVGGVTTSTSDFDGIFTIATTKVFELQHQCSVTQATTGFGVATNFGVSCVYSKVIVTKYS